MTTRIIAAIGALIFINCAATAQRMSREQYVEKYKNCAIEEMNKHGIPASITIAQGILESDCGNSYLATYANNHFGIKCHSDWKGERAYHDDDKNDECFRKYDNVQQSFDDHSLFLTTKSRYKSLFSLKRTDYKAWAHGLKAAGYATDPNYAKRLIDIIEALGLNKLDSQTAVATPQPTPAPANTQTAAQPQAEKTITIRRDASFTINPFHEHKVEFNNGVRYVTLNADDTFEAIAVEFHLMVSELLHYNDLQPGADIKSLKHLYIRAKRNRAHPDCAEHTVRKGDTAWSIAHKYGIKLKKLRRYNRLPAGAEPTVGDTLRLR